VSASDDGRVPRRRVKPVSLVTRATVGVVIPCYNYAEYVVAAIDSVLSQAGVDVDIVVVDDASTDASSAVVREIADREPRVRLLQHEHNRGPVETFNDGLAAVRGEYLVRLDADDMLTPGSLQRSVALAQAHPSVGLVYGHPLHFSGHVPPKARERPRKWTVWDGRGWLRQRARTGLNVITSPEVLMRRSIVDTVGGQRALAHTHDMEMWLRIAAVSDVAYIHGADQAWHREHARSLSQSIEGGIGDLRDRRDAFHTLFDWSAAAVPETAALRRLADRALSDEALQRIVHLHDRRKADEALVADLWAFARELEVEPTTSLVRGIQAAQARGGSAHARPWHVARAAYRRLANEIRFRRWHRDGVFHRDRA
jgi:GT2 family glycosyltransferase